MGFYAVKEYNQDVLVTDSFDTAIHEMLSYVYNRSKHLASSGINLNKVDFSDIYVEEFNPDNAKRFRYTTNKIKLNFNTWDLEFKFPNSDIKINLIVLDLLHEIHGFFSNSKFAYPVPTSQPLPQPTQDTPAQASNDQVVQNSVYIPEQKIKSNISKDYVIYHQTNKVNKSDILNPDDLFENDPDDKSDDKSDDEMLELLKSQIEALEKLKADGIDNMNELNKQQEEKVTKLIDHAAEVNYLKKKLFIKKEQEEEKRNIFKSDKKTYRMMRDDIKLGRLPREQISPLFKLKYPIFEFLDSKNLLGPDGEIGEDYFMYTFLHQEQNPPENIYSKQNLYIPHNYNFLSDDEKAKYSHCIDQKDDMIEQFINSSSNTDPGTITSSAVNKIKPLEEYLKDLEDVSVCDIGPCDDDEDDIPDIQESNQDPTN